MNGRSHTRITHSLTNDLGHSLGPGHSAPPRPSTSAHTFITHRKTNDKILPFFSSDISIKSVGKIGNLSPNEEYLCNLFINNRLQALSENYPPSRDWFPPFSLFIEFIDIMIKNRLSFLVIGPQNAVTYKNTAIHIMKNEMWMGYHYHLAGFHKPDGTKIGKQDNLARSCGWWTNLPVSYRNKRLMLDEEYNPEKYPHYDNYDAIEVEKTKEIPYDYDGVMGVPITFLQKYCPEQFEILGVTQIGCHDAVPDIKKYNDFKEILSENDTPTGSSGGKTNENAVLPGKGNKKTYYLGPNGEVVHSEYKRLLIRKKK